MKCTGNYYLKADKSGCEAISGSSIADCDEYNIDSTCGDCVLNKYRNVA